MKPLVCFFIALSTAGVLAQDDFEPADFDISKALLNNGVDATTVPDLKPLTQDSNTEACCSAACNALRSIFGDDKLETQAETAYTAFINSYWSAQQREIAPQCIFKPETALDVSTAILISRLTKCPFAAKSGGHSAVPGGSNIAGGITISFEKLSKIEVSSDKTIVSFQPGHTWDDIYTALEKQNLTVIGGRVSSVGVGGLTLGGGISYFSSEYGLACDNVASYELVTATGKIITVSQSSYADLYWALRGGGNNFGIVTQFNVGAIPRAPTMWGGSRYYLPAQFPALINAFYNLGQNAKEDGKAHQILSFGWGGMQVGVLELEYADPVANASILSEYNAIQGAIVDKTGIRSLKNLTSALAEAATGSGLRQGFWTYSTKLDKDLVTAAKDIFFEEISSIISAEGLVPAVSLQVLTESILQKTTTRGGNALGLEPNGGPIQSILVSIKWKNKADDDRINAFAAKNIERGVAAAKAKGKAVPYLYMNYAGASQDVVAGYGSANKARLMNISNKYDPTGVFEKLQPGYFKLNGAPKSG